METAENNIETSLPTGVKPQQGPEWLAVYTRPRWEKKIRDEMEREGIECYVPLNLIHRQWSDRIKKVWEPLFRGYVFVRVTPQNRAEVRYITGVLNFVYWLGKPAIIKDQEIEDIKRFTREYTDVQVVPLTSDISPGDHVRITSGLLMGYSATATRIINKRLVELDIQSIGRRLIATVELNQLERLLNGQKSNL